MAAFALRRVLVRTFAQQNADAPTARATASGGGANRRSARPFVPSLASEWIGEPAEHVRVPVEIVAITDIGHRIQRYLVRQIGTHNLLEWSSARRYGFRVGDRVKLSGLVQAHIRRDDVCITTLHECFNPLRMT
ncbi:hypothetical protein ACWKWA_10650 [Dermacoccus abyssi]